MKGVFTVNIGVSAVAAPATFIYITVPYNRIIEIISVIVTNKTVATTEQFECGLYRVQTLGSPTAVELTPIILEGDTETLVTAFGPVTANEPTYETNPLHNEGWLNVLGYRFEPFPENRPYVQPGESVGIRFLSTPLEAFDASAEIVFREIGG